MSDLKKLCFLAVGVFGLSAHSIAQILEPQWAYAAHNGGKVVMDKSDNLYRTGIFTSTADLDHTSNTASFTTAGQDDIFIEKFGNDGKLIWIKTIGGSGIEQYKDIAVDGQGNSYVLGTFSSATIDIDPGPGTQILINKGGADVFILKLSANGDFIWGKTLIESTDVSHLVGMERIIYYHKIYIDKQENIVIAGEFELPIKFDQSVPFNSMGGKDVYFAKYDKDCNFIFAKHIAGSSESSVASVSVDQQNSILLAINFYDEMDVDPSSATSLYTGAPKFTGPNNNREYNDMAFISYTETGSIKWSKHYTGNDWSITADSYINTDKPGSIFLTGGFFQFMDFGPDLPAPVTAWKYGAFIAEYTLDGKMVSFRPLVEKLTLNMLNGRFNVPAMAFDKDWNMIILGYFAGEVDFGSVTLKASGSHFIAKYKPDGTWLWAYPLGGLYITDPRSLNIDSKGDFVVSGSVYATQNGDFDPRACFTQLDFHPPYSRFIAKYKEVPVPIINSFSMPGEIRPAIINQSDKIIYSMVSPRTDLKALAPLIGVNRGTLDVPSGTSRDFSGTVSYNILEDCIKYPYKVEVYKAYAGEDESFCAGTTLRLKANYPKTGGKGTWQVIEPAGFDPFDASTIHQPQADIKVPEDVKIVLRWTIEYPWISESLSDDVEIYNHSLPFVDAGEQQVMNYGEQVFLTVKATGSAPFTYLWHPALSLSDATAKSPVASPIKSTKYFVTVTNVNGCESTDSIEVLVKTDLIIPSAFTPNGDGVNDTWNLKNIESHTEAEVDIYNRFGQRIYHSKGYTKSWDGKIAGAVLPAGNYYYIIRTGGKDNKLLNGSVAILY